MAGAEWLALLCQHIPDRYEQLVRYVGWYSNRSSGVGANDCKDGGWSARLPALAEQADQAQKLPQDDPSAPDVPY